MIILPVYNMVVLPEATYSFQPSFYEETSGKKAELDETVVFMVLKSEKSREEMTEDDFYPIGVIGSITNIEDGSVDITTSRRLDIDTISIEDGEIEISYAVRDDIVDMNAQGRHTCFDNVRTELLNVIKNYPWGMMVRTYIAGWDCLEDFLIHLAPHLAIKAEEKYEILRQDRISDRVQLMEDAVYELVEFLKVGQEIQHTIDEDHQKQYRMHAIKRQMSMLQEELDKIDPAEDDSQSEFLTLAEKVRTSGMNDIAMKEAMKILKRMKQEGEQGHEYGIHYDYIDFVSGLSWKKEPFKDISIDEAAKILDEDHYGMKKPKNRIIEHLAVMALKKKQSGSILCFAGSPGTGKTSIGASIAKALGRPYVRVSLGGVRDEAEIRGHRRTYVGAMPGRIMEGIRRSGASNPVMVLDEIDKLAKAFDGDPSSALLEVLDPEQNNSFTDHYMNVPYDLSDVLFICTANDIGNIPGPLYDRMEVIQFAGYTESEKMQIAKKHLIPQALEKNGLKKNDMKISDKALHMLISGYTCEAGVRGLKKAVDTLCRRTALEYVKGEHKTVKVSAKNLKEMMDSKPVRFDKVGKAAKPGIVTGLAWTAAGGDVLFIETMLTKGKGRVQITGQLGDVMKESVQIAVSLVKNLYPEAVEVFEKHDLHVHVPAGATPKDGPSAGITLTTAISSLVSGCPIPTTVAMTGEVSLRGGVMPIGGLPEKLSAAVRAGVKTVFIPKDNVEDLEEIADEVKNKLTIIPVSNAEEVLKKLKVEWKEEEGMNTEEKPEGEVEIQEKA